MHRQKKSRTVEKLLDRARLDLPNSLTGQTKVLAHLAEGHRDVGVQAEPHADHRGLALLQVVELLEEASAAHRSAGKRIIISANPLPGLDDEVRIEPVAHRRPGVIYGLGNLIDRLKLKKK